MEFSIDWWIWSESDAIGIAVGIRNTTFPRSPSEDSQKRKSEVATENGHLLQKGLVVEVGVFASNLLQSDL